MNALKAESSSNQRQQSRKARTRSAQIGEVVGTIPVIRDCDEQCHRIEIPIPVGYDSEDLKVCFVTGRRREQFRIIFEPSDDGTRAEVVLKELPHRIGIVLDHIEDVN